MVFDTVATALYQLGKVTPITVLAKLTPYHTQVVAATALRAEAAGGGEAALLRAWEPFSVGWKAVWWEAVARPADVEVREEKEFRQQLRDLATESAALLAQALPETAVREP